MPGVERRRLDRMGEEVGRATSIVRYGPGRRFPRRIHAGGEEILVLEDLFPEEWGPYPAGTWLRKPPGSTHRPWSEMGCRIGLKTGHRPATLPPRSLGGTPRRSGAQGRQAA